MERGVFSATVLALTLENTSGRGRNGLPGVIVKRSRVGARRPHAASTRGSATMQDDGEAIMRTSNHERNKARSVDADIGSERGARTLACRNER